MEDPRLIAEYLLRYIRAAGHPGRVMASTDCGFASTARSTAITADLASWLPTDLQVFTLRVVKGNEIQRCFERSILKAGILGNCWIHSVSEFHRISEFLAPWISEAWMKLRSLAEGAKLATRNFLEQRAPVPCRSVTLASTPFQAVIFSPEDL